MANSQQRHRLVIGGGGFAGVKLAMELANNELFEIVLVSDRSAFEYHAALYRSATGKSPLEVVLPLSGIFKHAENVELVLDRLVSVDNNRKVAISETENEYAYDSLVLALGQVSNYYGIKGLEKNSFSLDTIANTIKLRHHLHDMVLDNKQKNLNFVVVGAGASGTELAAEMGFYIDHLANAHNIDSKPFEVVLIEGSDRPLPALSDKISNKAVQRLDKLDVRMFFNRNVNSISFDSLEADDISLKTHTVVWTAGSKTSPFYSENEGIFKLDDHGKVEVDEFMRANESIYVIGDNANTEYSGMAQTALYDAAFVAKNLRRHVHGHERIAYKPKRPVYVIPAGGSYALMQWGRFVITGYPAWIVRRFADFRLFSYFEPFKLAVKTWRSGSRKARTTCEICGHVQHK